MFKEKTKELEDILNVQDLLEYVRTILSKTDRNYFNEQLSHLKKNEEVSIENIIHIFFKASSRDNGGGANKMVEIDNTQRFEGLVKGYIAADGIYNFLVLLCTNLEA